MVSMGMNRLTVLDLACWTVFLGTASQGASSGTIVGFVCLVIAFIMMCITYWGMYGLVILFLLLPESTRRGHWWLHRSRLGLVIHSGMGAVVLVLWALWVFGLIIAGMRVAQLAVQYM